MSQEGYDKLIAELKRLESIERPKASAAIAEAREKGDLSENSEYDAAKEAQAHLEDKINQLKVTISEAKVVDTSRLSTDAVQILSKVEMTNLANKAKMTYTIVSESEANLREGKISIKTPIAQGLLNHKVGDEVEVKIPRGTKNYRWITMDIFSKIAAGEIPSYKCAENEKFYAFLDINPLVKGHTLVIPRREVDYIFDMEDDEIAEFQVFAKRVAKAIGKAFPCKKVAQVVLGLEVPHAHIHLIPMQSEGDVDFRREKLKLTPEEFQEIASKIRDEFV